MTQNPFKKLALDITRLGVLISVFSVLIGGILYLWDQGSAPYATAAIVHQQATLSSGTPIIMFGIGALMITQLLRLMVLMINFSRKKQWGMGSMTAFIIFMIFVSTILH